METIDTIITNAGILAHAHIDWSPGAGPIWLAGYMAVMVVFGAYCTIQGVRDNRRATRQALYRRAESAGRLRDSFRSMVGHLETMQ
jgi:hypothetical protein